uniref:Unannotated protein n=1 Tax=freshwater metagenome TaxID=449393 RepID=A0A6J5ZR16_9ZZZZ
MSKPHRSLLKSSIAAAAVAALLVPGASLAQAKTVKAPSGAAFYKAPAKLIKGKPGTIIWSRTIPYTANGRVAPFNSGKTMLVLYRSRSITGKPIAVSGTIDVPKGTPPAGGWKMVSWAHGTTGAADVCAPSRTAPGTPADGYIAYADATVNGWLGDGYAVLRTDFEGLGTPGPHPYLIGASEGRGVVDIASAAKSMLGSKVSSDWVIGGHSQGGQSALFAASLAKKLAPKLKLKGVFAYAPASNIALQRVLIPSLGDAYKGLSGIAVLILNSAAQQAKVKTASLVNPGPAALLPQIEKVCLSQLGSAEMFGQWAPKDILKPGIKTPAIDAVIKAMNPDVKIDVPVMILQGKSDTTVLPYLTDRLVEKAVNLPEGVDYRKFDGLTHTTIVTDPAPDAAALGFIQAHFGQ